MAKASSSIDLRPAKDASKTATSYITEIDGGGIKVHDANDSSDYAQITGDGMDVYNDGENVARFGSDGARLGMSNKSHIEVHSDSLLFEDANSARLISMTTYPDTTVYNHMTFTADGVTTVFNVESSQYIQITARSFSGVLVLLDGVPTNKAMINYQAGIQQNDLTIKGVRFDSTDVPMSGTVIDVYISSDTHSHLQIGSSIYSTQESTSRYGTNSLGIGSCTAYGDGSLAAGFGSNASGIDSVAFSYGDAIGNASIAACSGMAFSERAVAIGYESHAWGIDSHALGYRALTRSDNQTVIGKANVQDDNGDYALIIGNGTSDTARSNAFTVDWDGNIMTQGMAGMIQMFAGSTAPAGWLMCNGAAVSRTDYAELFAIIGTTYGAGDGSTTFNLPDMRGRFPLGSNSSYALNAKAGSADAVVVSHTHPTASNGYLYMLTHGAISGGDMGSQSGSGRHYPYQGNRSDGAYWGSQANTGAASSGVSGTGKNMPPYIGINFIIATGKTS